jgi:hypothetical protein
LPMIVLLNKQGKLDAPVTIGMKSQPEDYKAEIRARLNKLLTIASTEAESAQEAAARASVNAAATATLSQRQRQ